jgi:hypothetical protein
VHIDGKHRLIVIFYSSFSLDPAPLMESFVKVLNLKLNSVNLFVLRGAAAAPAGQSID